MRILGISAFYHDSAAALVVDGEIIAAAQEERFTRKKHDSSFPTLAVKYCLNQGACLLSNVDFLVFYDKPFLKFERLLETYYLHAPKGVRQFCSFAPVWIKEKLFLKKTIRDSLKAIDPNLQNFPRILFPEHHLSHAASAFFPSPFDKAAILTVDGVGEWATAAIMLGKDNSITKLKELRYPHSIGMLYSAFTYYLGFKVNSGEYKLMGMAPYGNPGSDKAREFLQKICEIVDVKEDGSIFLNQEYFSYSTSLKIINERKWERLFGLKTRSAESQIEQSHCDLAWAIQAKTDEIVLKLAGEAQRITGAESLCMAGGVALNCVSNGRLAESGLFKGIWIQPAAGDAGGALGAALAAHYIYAGSERKTDNKSDKMKGSYLGPSFSDEDAGMLAKRFGACFTQYDKFVELCEKVVDLLCEGNVIGWHQGAMEWGQRALGNRSILADPRNEKMQKVLNLKIKCREGFRPFAPSVLSEDASAFFEINNEMSSQYMYMLITADVVKSRRLPLPENYHNLPLFEKLYHVRSDVPSVTHLDYSARVQAVHRETNPRYWQLINTFRNRTGYGLLVNTSFNVRGEPIVCTPEDSFRCFMGTKIHALVIENCLFIKTDQPNWDNNEIWTRQFELD
ncbi:MAG: carbamoyltransferase [Oligoflexales bacterium]|nr:carbamoyltransferase [Oligoflexales bacterium]